MFTRGPGPLVSILLPTRGRTKLLYETIDSLHSLAKNPGQIEYLFKVDSDDTGTTQAVLKLANVLNCKILVSPRGGGYHELHRFINELAAIASGDWLFIFNDDARMCTQNWDERLEQADPWQVPRWAGNDDVCLLGPRVVEREISWEFPILRRKVTQILGHFSRCYSNDAYIYWVMAGISAACVLSTIEVTHFVNDISDNTKIEGKLTADRTMHKVLSDDSLKALYEEDRTKLRAYLTKGS